MKYYTLSFSIRSVLMYRRTHLTRNDEVDVFCFTILSLHKICKTKGHFVSRDLFTYYLNWTGVPSKWWLEKVDRR